MDVTRCCPTHCTDWCLDKDKHDNRLCCEAEVPTTREKV